MPHCPTDSFLAHKTDSSDAEKDRIKVDLMLENNAEAIQEIFQSDFLPLFQAILANTPDEHKIELNELSEAVFRYLTRDNWAVLRQFGFRCRLNTWICVIAQRIIIHHAHPRIFPFPEDDTPR